MTQTAVAPRMDLNTNVDRVGESPIRRIFGMSRGADMISFAGGHPAAEFFDVAGVSESLARVMSQQGARALQYGPTNGEPEMIAAAIARLAYVGVQAAPDSVLVTSGSQQGISLSAVALCNPGDTVLVENPTYMSALQALGLHGVRLVGVPTDGDGVDPEALAAAIARHRPKALYLIPNFQNPTGVTMSQRRRTQVADVLASSDVWLIEDDPYGELKFAEVDTSPIARDPRLRDRSVLLGSLSKVLAPGLRMGWLCAPPEIVERAAIVKQGTALQSSTLDQLAAADYLARTDIGARLAPARAEYARRARHLVDGLREVLPAGSRVNDPSGGMFTWVRLPHGYDAGEAVDRAVAAGVIFVPGLAFYAENPNRATLRLSFVNNDVDTNAKGLERLACALN